jgi:hypothetical protein
MNKKWIISLCIAGTVAVIIGAYFIFNNFFSKGGNPKLAVLDALRRTVSEINAPGVRLGDVYALLTADAYRQDVTLGINRMGGSLLPDIDPRILSLMELFTLRYSGRRSSPSAADARRLDSLGVNLAVTGLADIIVYSEPERLALTVPQLADFYVTLDPRRIARDWDESLLGRYFFPLDGLILEEPFYDYFSMIMFPEKHPAKPAEEPSHLLQSITALFEDAEITLLSEKKNLTDGATHRVCDAYRITVTQEAMNRFWRELRPDFNRFPDDLIGDALNQWAGAPGTMYFERGLDIEVYVYRRRIAGIHLETRVSGFASPLDIEGTVQFNGQSAILDRMTSDWVIGTDTGGLSVYAALASDVGNPDTFVSEASISVRSTNDPDGLPLTAGWDIKWDRKQVAGDNFTLRAGLETPGDYGAAVTAAGIIMADAERGYLDVNLRNAALDLRSPWGGLDTSLSARYILRPDNETISIDGQAQLPLSEIGELDVLLMLGRLMGHPVLGGLLGDLLGNLLPF